MSEDVDWTHGAEHMFEKHQITVAQANEALHDPLRVVIQPDYNSKSGNSIRVIGYCQSRGYVLTVILVVEDGITYGVNGWSANDRDRRLYTDTTIVE